MFVSLSSKLLIAVESIRRKGNLDGRTGNCLTLALNVVAARVVGRPSVLYIIADDG